MQGTKNFQPEMFVNFRLDEHIPQDNFYRILKGILDLSFIKKKTQFCYATKWVDHHSTLLYFSKLSS